MGTIPDQGNDTLNTSMVVATIRILIRRAHLRCTYPTFSVIAIRVNTGLS